MTTTPNTLNRGDRALFSGDWLTGDGAGERAAVVGEYWSSWSGGVEFTVTREVLEWIAGWGDSEDESIEISDDGSALLHRADGVEEPILMVRPDAYVVGFGWAWYVVQPDEVTSIAGDAKTYLDVRFDVEVQTREGRARLLEMLRTDDPTDYQQALYAYWTSEYADAVQTACEESAEQAGAEAGKAAGSWVINGNTTEETARKILTGIKSGDPEVLDGLPSSPLSGEYADCVTPRDVLAEHTPGWAEDADGADDVLRAYEDAYASAVTDEVERSARAVLPTDDDEDGDE